MEITPNVGGCPKDGCTLEQFVERSKKFQMLPSPHEVNRILRCETENSHFLVLQKPFETGCKPEQKLSVCAKTRLDLQNVSVKNAKKQNYE